MFFSAIPKTKYSPWGAIQHEQEIQEGIQFISTARHGGYKLDRKQNAKIPDQFRRKGGWYEEDCEAAIPMYFLLNKQNVLQSIKRWYPYEYESYFNEIIPAGVSFIKDKDNFYKTHQNDWEFISLVD